MTDAEEPTIEDYLKVIIVGQQRIYDTLLIMLATTDREAFEKLVRSHEQYGNVGPLPYEEA